MGAQDYILTFARQLTDGQVHSLHQSHAGFLLAHSIDRIETVGRAAFIWKKEQDSLGIDYEWLELLVQRNGLPHSWAFLAGYILRTNGPLPIAERAARTAADADVEQLELPCDTGSDPRKGWRFDSSCELL